MFSPNTYSNICINKDEGSIMEKSLNAFIKIKSSLILASDVFSSANEEAACYHNQNWISLSKLYIFIYLDFPHYFNFYYFFRKVWYLWRVCRKLSQQIGCRFFQLYFFFNPLLQRFLVGSWVLSAGEVSNGHECSVTAQVVHDISAFPMWPASHWNF